MTRVGVLKFGAPKLHPPAGARTPSRQRARRCRLDRAAAPVLYCPHAPPRGTPARRDRPAPLDGTAPRGRGRRPDAPRPPRRKAGGDARPLACPDPGAPPGGRRLAPRLRPHHDRARRPKGRLQGRGALPAAAGRRGSARPGAGPEAPRRPRAPPRHRPRRHLASLGGQPAGRPAPGGRHGRGRSRRTGRARPGLHRPHTRLRRRVLGLLPPDRVPRRRLVRRAAGPVGPRLDAGAPPALRAGRPHVVAVARPPGPPRPGPRPRAGPGRLHHGRSPPDLHAHPHRVGRAPAEADLARPHPPVGGGGGRRPAALARAAARGSPLRPVAPRRGRHDRRLLGPVALGGRLGPVPHGEGLGGREPLRPVAPVRDPQPHQAARGDRRRGGHPRRLRLPGGDRSRRARDRRPGPGLRRPEDDREPLRLDLARRRPALPGGRLREGRGLHRQRGAHRHALDPDPHARPDARQPPERQARRHADRGLRFPRPDPLRGNRRPRLRDERGAGAAGGCGHRGAAPRPPQGLARHRGGEARRILRLLPRGRSPVLVPDERLRRVPGPAAGSPPRHPGDRRAGGNEARLPHPDRPRGRLRRRRSSSGRPIAGRAPEAAHWEWRPPR